MLAKFMAAFLYVFFFYILAIKQEQTCNFLWFGLLLECLLPRKAINAFIYSKHAALRSMKQGSCITEATLIEIGVL